jgi:hypothetical protein
MTAFDDAESGPTAALARFTCARDGRQAGIVHLHRFPDGSDWLLVLEGFLGKDSVRLGPAAGDALVPVLRLDDAAGLYALNLEFAPFYCPECRRVYCADCWRMFNVFADDLPGFLEEVRGICPEGHERMLSD